MSLKFSETPRIMRGRIDSIVENFSHHNDMPHLILHGPSGSGKKTLCRMILSNLYGKNSSEKIKVNDHVFQSPSGRNIDITLFSSNNHIEFDASDIGPFDRVVVQEIIKDFAKEKFAEAGKVSFKAAIIYNSDSLSKEAQQALRRTIEKYCRNIRLILCCSSSSKLIPPIRSRALMLRVPAFTDAELRSIFNSKNVEKFDGNCLAASTATEIFNLGLEPYVPDWEVTIEEISSILLVKAGGPEKIYKLREHLQKLIVSGISASLIIRKVTSRILQTLPESLNISHLAAIYDHRSSKSSKPIIHLEAFFFKVEEALIL